MHSDRITLILASLGILEAFGLLFTFALCRAASRRPVYGPPVRELSDDAR